MNFKEMFKKFWFVILIAILFIGFIIAYAVNTVQNREIVKEPKKVDGQYIIYSINGENYTADDLYGDLKGTYGINSLYQTFDRFVCDQAIETTKEMKDIAANNAAYLLQQYGEDELTAQMQKLGYKDASETANYYIYLQKAQALRQNFLKEHMDEYVTPFVNEVHPKTISHILVKVANVEKTENEDGTTTLTAKPTDEEQAKLDEILKALETETFEEVAAKYSEDGSAQNGGYLGYFDDQDQKLVKEFADVCKQLKGGEVSEVVTTEFGFHIIKCNTDDATEMLSDPFGSEFINAIFGYHGGNLFNTPLIEKAEELGIVIKDEELNQMLMDAIGTKAESEEAK